MYARARGLYFRACYGQAMSRPITKGQLALGIGAALLVIGVAAGFSMKDGLGRIGCLVGGAASLMFGFAVQNHLKKAAGTRAVKKRVEKSSKKVKEQAAQDNSKHLRSLVQPIGALTREIQNPNTDENRREEAEAERAQLVEDFHSSPPSHKIQETTTKKVEELETKIAQIEARIKEIESQTKNPSWGSIIALRGPEMIASMRAKITVLQQELATLQG